MVDRAVARLLSLGTRGATGVIAAGCIGELASPRLPLGVDLYGLGVALFVLLPVASLFVMALLYVRQGRHVLGATAVLVLLIVGVGSVGSVATGLASRNKDLSASLMPRAPLSFPPQRMRPGSSRR